VSVYVYGLLATTPPEPLGVGIVGEPLRVAKCGRLLAVVGDMAEVPPVSATTLREHDRVVRRLSAMADAALPVRFGSLVDDEGEIARHLESAEEALERALDLVKGREQMTVRIYQREESREQDEPRPAEPAPADLGPGARYLHARRQASAQEARSAALAALLPALETLVSAERIEAHETPPLIASIHHLVERGRGAAYTAAVDMTAAGLDRVRVVVGGPWPPYAFASEGVS
jgi:Gas vesicle synthesis protein GvpL/GvpF